MLLTSLLLCSGLAAAKGDREPDSHSASAHRAFNSSDSRLVVDRFTGSSTANVARAGVINALEAEDTVDLVSVRLLDAQHGTLDGSPSGYARVAERLDLGAILRGKVKSSAEGAHITLTLISGRDGKAIGKLSFEARTMLELRAKLQAELWGELKPLLDAAAGRGPSADASTEDTAPDEAGAPPAAGPKLEAAKPPAESTPPVPAPKPEARPKPGPPPVRCPRVEFELGGGAQGRNFNYVHEQRGALRAYRASPVPVARGDLVGYPLASTSCRVRAGLALGFERLLKVESQLAGSTLATNGFGSHAELVLRLSLGPLTLEPGLGYADRHFAVAGGFVPVATYQALRGRLRADLELGRLLLEARGGGRFVLAAGQLENADWFPNAQGVGYDAEARVGIRLGNWLDLLLGARYEFYSFKLKPSAGDIQPHGVAQRADDEYFDASLNLRFRL